MLQPFLTFALSYCIATACLISYAGGQPPENFRRDRLVAWCVVPFDARHRTPQARAEMLKRIGLLRCAYDWRAEHVSQFQEEIVQYRRNGIEFFAFWDQHEKAFELFDQHQLTPQIWKTLAPRPSGETQEEKIKSAAKSIMPLTQRARQLGCQLGLYNHGGWGGEPENLVAVCRALRDEGLDNVGIVYNFHHGHGHIHDFKQAFELMKPYLLCVNLNGMVDLAEARYKDQPGSFKILPIGKGQYERQMIQVIVESGYQGAIGVLGHVAHRDVEKVLNENLAGLEKIVGR